jgi:murein DD-endopeptidase MepM/ murein hydrolase activator NlpD
MHLRLAERQKSFTEMKTWVNTVQQRYSAMPSEWPVYGRIMSYFGYRIFPWRGFHAGIDISSAYGTPVRATANGVVLFTGWRTGYGRTVEIDHGNGISTLYGHNCRFAVKAGQKVKKGQVICYVGTSGYSTGPHLHYEVHKYQRVVNPFAFLNLDLLTACKIWRQ